MLRQILSYIKSLFGINKTVTDTKQQYDNQNYASQYADTTDINFTAIFANNLSSLSVSDCSAEVTGDNKRAELLDKQLKNVWSKIKKITSSALGAGGCLVVPYVKNNKILFTSITQDRLVINETDGDLITNATIIADSVSINNVRYYRLVNHMIKNNNLYITNKVISEYGINAKVPQWENISDVSISNVDRVLFGFIKSPIDNRKTKDDYGVPVTYGCGKIIEDIKECLEEIRVEFELKEVRLQVDERAFEKDPVTGDRIIPNKLFLMGYNEKGDLFNVFDPAIRDSSYHARLEKLFELFEKQVGTSKGILTEPNSTYENTEAIRRSVQDTFSIITDIRKSIEKGLTDFIYTCNVLANYYNLSPIGDYELSFDWSYSIIENTTETWQQLKDGQAIGIRKKAELRAWQTGETIEEAQKVIDEIAKTDPDISALLGIK